VILHRDREKEGEREGEGERERKRGSNTGVHSYNTSVVQWASQVILFSAYPSSFNSLRFDAFHSEPWKRKRQ